MSPSGGFCSPPSLRPRGSFPFLLSIHRILGLLLTVILLFLLVLCIPAIIIMRIVGYVKRKSRRWQYDMSVCSHHWSISGAGPDVGAMLVEGDMDAQRLNEFVTKISLRDGRGVSNSVNDLSGDVCRPWNQSDSRLRNDDDLLRVVNDMGVFPRESTVVQITGGYFSSETNRESTLIVLSTPSASRHMCLPRMMSITSNQRMYFETEPLPIYHFFVPLRRYSFVHNAIVVAYRFLTEGPASLLSLALRRPSPLWKELEGIDTITPRNRRGVKSPLDRDSSSILMESLPDDVIVVSKEGEPHRHRTSSLLRELPPPSRRQCWRLVPSCELVGRAERLLRATSSELLLSLVAGTLRTYCRQQGILHPPDLSVLVPVSCRNFLPVACRHHCDTVLFPMMLPTGVEGAIPRLWSVQKRLYQNLNGHVPSTLKMAQIIARGCLPSDTAAGMLRPLYQSQAIYVAFYRAGGDLRLAPSVPIQSLLMFPSLSETTKAAFVFVQCGKETRICASLCKRTFPDPEAVMNIFESETRHLLDHLSLRLLSLPQSTILPGHFNRNNTEDETEMFGSSYLRQKTSELSSGGDVLSEEDEYSMEELLRLLATVQTELDGMRANPQGDRGEYIRKLTELEDRMQRFHQCITSRLGGTEGTVGGEDGVVDNILAPYKDGPDSSRPRRFSREFNRTEELIVRKPSRSSI